MSSTVPAVPPSAIGASSRGPSYPWLPPTWALTVGLIAVAANLRVGLAGVPPLVGLITSDLGLSNAAIGVLTTLPVLCMGLFAPVAHWASTKWGSAPVVLLATVLAGLGSLLRLWGANLAVLYAATLVLGVGIAISGTLLPRLVKTMFPPERVGLVTGVYMLALMGGATASAALSAPLAQVLGSWQGSLASWALVGLVGVVAWLPLSRQVWVHRAEVTALSVGARLPWRSRTAWLVAGYLVIQSWAFYSTLAWLAPSYVQLGWDREHAGYLLSLFSGVQIVAGLVVPAITDRVRDLRTLLIPTTLCGASGLVALAVAPEAAPWLWAVLVGLGQGSAFALALVLLVRAASTPHASGGLSAMGFCIGYGVASVGPLAMGAVRDATVGFHAVWVVLAALMAVQAAVSLRLRPGMAQVGES
jgi:MFS transporter, CP family, cyanate transporter